MRAFSIVCLYYYKNSFAFDSNVFRRNLKSCSPQINSVCLRIQKISSEKIEKKTVFLPALPLGF